MIVRTLPTGDTIVAAQTDHSRLVGQLAAHWGNTQFDVPTPYESGLIVNMHRTGLWKARYDTITHPIAYNLSAVPPEIAEFITKNEAWQAQTSALFNRDELWINYRLLQISDLLGLYFCCQDPYEDYIEPVPVRYGAGRDAGTTMTLRPVGDRRVAVDPYPFDVRPCRVQLAFRRLPSASFPSVEAFRRAYVQADDELMNFELV